MKKPDTSMDELAWKDASSGFLIWEELGQYKIEFERAGSLAEMIVQKRHIKDILLRLSSSTNELMEKHRENLEARGVRVFEVKRHNDRVSVEVDYGAPAKGLAFAHDMVDLNRAFRYEPMHHVLGTYKTHLPQALAIAKAQQRKGYKYFDDFSGDECALPVHFSNGGVTGAFSDIVKLVIENHNDVQSVKQELGFEQRGAIIVPVPTYGLFLHRLEELVDGQDIDIVAVHRKDSGAVDGLSLRNTLDDCRSRNVRPLAYYDCNPQNPTGHVRERPETERIAAILQDEINYLLEQEIALISSIEDRLPGNKQVGKWIGSLENACGGIVIIDDMAYEGLQFSAQQKPASFAQISSNLAQYTVVLKSLSKIGLPGARVGLVMAHPSITENLADRQLTEHFCANSMGVDILAARFGGTKDQRRKFLNHEAGLRHEHRRKAGIIEAFVNGLDDTQKLSGPQKDRLVRDYAGYAGIDAPGSRARLKQGLTQFSLPDDLECGFFYRLYCENLRGKAIATKFEDKSWITTGQIQDSDTLYWVFRSFGMRVVSSSQQGSSPEDLSVRITTSLPDKELFRFYDSMRAMQNHFFGEKPSRQLDLFRKNIFQPI